MALVEWTNNRVSGFITRKSGGTARKRPDVNYFGIGRAYTRFFDAGKYNKISTSSVLNCR
ncbi:hypothetical protein EFM34_08930 [Leuconostoc suionicum]|nr:hypothetical protein [Leuconostoc suionicum]